LPDFQIQFLKELGRKMKLSTEKFQINRRKLNTMAVLSALMPVSSIAQTDYPNRPVKVISPFSAGAFTDGITRAYIKELQDRLGQPFVLEHKPGASTNIATSFVSSAPADGHTLLISTLASHSLNKWSYKNLNFDAEKMLSAGMMGVNAFYVVVRSDSPFNSLQDLVKAAKESPTGLAYGSHGEGGANHVVTELFRTQAGIGKLIHVPYKGAESHRDLIAGRLDFMIDGAAINLVMGGRLRALAVAYPKRWPTQEKVPTMAESGYPEVTIATYFGLAAPSGTPVPILEKLNFNMREIAKDADFQKRMLSMNVQALPMTRQETDGFIKLQTEKWKPILRSLNISFD
jgi:tripartite-type tricarboxylate transporter receptor subunit TctC